MKTTSDSDFAKLETWLGTTYTFDDRVQVKLLRSYTNDVYLVTTGAHKTVLKVYSNKWRSESDIQYEVALLEHLAKKGLRVANTIVGKDGQTIYKLSTPNGEQFVVLFEYADGQKPQPPFSNELYVAFGDAIAQLHQLSDDFVTSYYRKSLDLSVIIESPLELALSLIKNEEDRVFLQNIAQKIINKLHELNTDSLDWGPIHGDATLDNLHVTADNQIVLYDFDSGGPGWRAADLQGWAYHNEPYAEKWKAFKQGYARVRQLKPHDLEAARYLAVTWLIWGLQIDLEHRILGQRPEKIAEYFTMQIGSIRDQAKLAFG